MIRGTHAAIRTAEPDDAPQFQQLYHSATPRSALLTRLREVIIPTVDELEEVFVQSEKNSGPFYAIEDKEGTIRGFCSLRTASQMREAAFYAELVLLFLDDNDYGGALAREVYEWLHYWAFVERRMTKLIIHCLDCETALREWAVSVGFESDGVQREVLFTQGRWHNIEALTLFATGDENRAEREGLKTGNGHSE